jgi:Polyphosphate kinase 2 (PPK2)
LRQLYGGRVPERGAEHLRSGSLDHVALWGDCTKAKVAMVFETGTADAPWTVIKSDCKEARAPERDALRAAQAAPAAARTCSTSAHSTRCLSAVRTWSTHAASAAAAR